MNQKPALILHARTALADGTLIVDSPEHIATNLNYAQKGDQITGLPNEYLFAVGTYSFERDPYYKEVYSYLRESAWITYNQDLDPKCYLSDSYEFKKECYYKLCFKRKDGQNITQEDLCTIEKSLNFTPMYRKEKDETSSHTLRSHFQQEISATVDSYNELTKQKEDTFSLILLTDSHYMINGTWMDTQVNIQKVAESIQPDAIVHLGDITDGLLPREQTIDYAHRTLDSLAKNGIPLYMTIGNHDANYFMNNNDVFSIEEQSKIYLDADKPYYYRDISGIRCIFLFSFDRDNIVRYGFLDEEIDWLKQLLKDTPLEQDMLILSHDAPLAQLDYWSETIYNGDRLIELLENENRRRSERVLAYIHGHTHADFIYKEKSFPIISIGCNKCEDFKEYKPEGSFTPKREFNDVTQDLWDVMIFNKKNRQLDFIRFGAGEDRRMQL